MTLATLQTSIAAFIAAAAADEANPLHDITVLIENIETPLDPGTYLQRDGIVIVIAYPSAVRTANPSPAKSVKQAMVPVHVIANPKKLYTSSLEVDPLSVLPALWAAVDGQPTDGMGPQRLTLGTEACRRITESPLGLEYVATFEATIYP